MTELRIRRLRKRYRLPKSARDERARLDRVLASAIDDQLLDAALAREGLPANEEICIRSVESVVRLRRSEVDSRLAAAWSIALADAIARRIRAGGPDVVRYGSRHQALAELVRDAARGGFERAWAWRRLGIWTARDALAPEAACAAVLAVLAANPLASVAVLREIAAEGALAPLLSESHGKAWIDVARAALAAAGATDAAIRSPEEEPSPESATTAAAAERIIARSRIARALTTPGASWPAEAARALGALVLLEAAPIDAAYEGAAEVVGAIARRLASASRAVENSGRSRRAARTSRSARTRDSEMPDAINAEHGEAPTARPDAVVERSAATEQPADDRARGVTASGGLLFLLHLVRALDLPAAARREPALADRPLAWVLHQLALALAPLQASDPAALAFAGLAPGAPPPSVGEPPARPVERAAIVAMRNSIITMLGDRMPPEDGDDASASLARVIARNAEIVSDPGWIEVRFALADASVSIRRAGLDLDPGWLPWLGVIVRFVYD